MPPVQPLRQKAAVGPQRQHPDRVRGFAFADASKGESGSSDCAMRGTDYAADGRGRRNCGML